MSAWTNQRREAPQGRFKLTELVSKGKETLNKLSHGGDQGGPIGDLMSSGSGPLHEVAAAVRSLGDDGGNEPGGDSRNVKKLRLIIKESIDVGVPRKVAYNQWTQFSELPSIMQGVTSVVQEDDRKTRWTAKIGPSRRNWHAEIVEQTPDERIVRQSTRGTESRGAVTFHSLDRNLTRVQVEMEYFPQGLVEKAGNLFLAARRRVRKDLLLFKHRLELAGKETGAWRGQISMDTAAADEADARDGKSGESSGTD